MKGRLPFEKLKEKQEDLQLLIIGSVILAVGSGLFAAGVIDLITIIELQVAEKLIAELLIAIILIFFTIFYLLPKIKIRNANCSVNFNGFYVYDHDKHNIKEIPRYDISADMRKYLKYACCENKDLKMTWETEDNFLNEYEHPKSLAIIKQLIEYCILNRISMHLIKYFQTKGEHEDINLIKRNDLFSIVQSNIFLDLFSKSKNTRPAFSEFGRFFSIDHGDTFISPGYFYKDICFILNKKSKIYRNKNNWIVIATEYFNLEIKIIFCGNNIVKHNEMLKYYINMYSEYRYLDFACYSFQVRINIKFKNILSNKMKINSWLDSLLDNLEAYIDEDAFLRKINWNTIMTIIEYEKNIKSKNNYKKSRKHKK